MRRARGLIPGLAESFSECWEVDMLHVDEDDMLARVLRASDVSEIMRSPSVALGAGKTSHLFDLSESQENNQDETRLCCLEGDVVIMRCQT